MYDWLTDFIEDFERRTARSKRTALVERRGREVTEGAMLGEATVKGGRGWGADSHNRQQRRHARKH